jgi:N-acetylmuramoyl-L-alanine amidase
MMEDHVQEPQARRPRRGGVSMLRQVYVVFGVGALMATLFTAWTPLGLFPAGLAERLAGALTGNPALSGGDFPTPTARPRPLVGLVVGHWGNDSGTVCPDGLQEVEINLEVATLAAEQLRAAGYDVDLLEEFDDRLQGYQALTLISIHADTCEFIDNNATGFKVAAALSTSYPEKANRLLACMSSRYSLSTGLRFHPGSVSPHMSSYHAFNEIHSDTTAAIIEVGFMNLDRQLLQNQPDMLARGIADGILCYIQNEDASAPEVEP